uniref:Fe2OG dioxygenase domain-containing protein n=1 Tax=Minutocellus polymorphus TaxID=265543 RepID=A0A6U0JCU9_9STRA|mmetsp:Transcript_17917/g.29724  ORF Transcript_17917/g.29724 Transcript_17917/m.29724 type:complete len:521 (+) Transcript_17917:82-1644(+)
MPPSSSPFAGEAFLINPPPDYPSEWRGIITRLVLCVSLFAVVVPISLPVLFGKKVQMGNSPSSGGGGSVDDESSQQQIHMIKKKKRDKRRKPTQKAKAEAESGTTVSAPNAPEMEPTAVEIPTYLLPLVNILCLIMCFFIVASSPNNHIAARAVYQAPLLTADECRRIIGMAHAVAERNVEKATKESAKMDFLRDAGIVSRVDDEADDFVQQHQRQGQDQQGIEGRSLLDEPKGWTKDRHTSYPTTDLNLVTVPFESDDRVFLQEILDARLAPLVERVYGIAPGAVRANDIFVVRYDYERGQKSLRGHTDSSHVSFNILLNDEFTGGGTRFHNRVAGTYQDGKPNPGEVLINNALVFHEGLSVSSGTRYILVGFMSADRVDPMSQEATGLNTFASWLSLPWLQVQLKDAIYSSYERMNDGGEPKWTDNKYIRNLFRDIVSAAQLFGDLWAPHTLTKLVDDANASKFIHALDEAESRKREQGAVYRRANWFKNQQLHVDIDGTVTKEWATRKRAGGKFQEL